MTLRVHPEEIVRCSNSALLSKHPSWERVPLGHVAEVTNGFAFKSTLFNANGVGVPLIRIRDVGQAGASTFYSGKYGNEYIVKPGSLVVGMDGDFRIARWTGPEALLNQRVCRITARNDTLYNEQFLFYVLPGYLDAIHAHTSSITVKHLSSNTMAETPLPLPPLTEQERIVAAIEEQFSRLDAAEASLRRAQRNLDRMRTAVLHVAAQHGEEVRLSELLSDIEAGKSFKCDGRPAGPGEWGVIKVSAMTWGRFKERENKAIPESRAIDPRWEIRPGDLLLSRANTSEYVGATVLVGSCRSGLVLSDKSMRLHVRPDVDKVWLQLALSSALVRQQMSAVATGTSDSMRNISQDKVRALHLRKPPLDEQRRIVAEVEQQLSIVDAMKATVERALKRSGSLRRAILERAFRGELVPQDPDDEPASALLERIAAERAQAPKARRRGAKPATLF